MAVPESADRVLPIECWEYRLGEAEVPDVLRLLADDLDETDGVLLSLIVGMDDAPVQAFVERPATA